MSVVALQSGTVTTVLAEVGQTVTPAQPIVSILPRGAALEASLYVPSRAVGFVEVGQQVLMRYQAYPYQKFGQYPGTEFLVWVRLVAHQHLLAGVPIPEIRCRGIDRISGDREDRLEGGGAENR